MKNKFGVDQWQSNFQVYKEIKVHKIKSWL